MSYKEIGELRMPEFRAIIEAVDRMIAQENLAKLSISVYSIMKKDARDKLYKSFHEVAFPKEEIKPMTTDEIDEELRKVFNGQ